MKPIIVICGANHSGTSAVAEFLHKHGAELGRTDGCMCDDERPYPTYENVMFKRWCKGEISDEEVRHYVSMLDRGKVYVFKYPGSYKRLNDLDVLGRPFKVILVLRKVIGLIASYRKQGLDPEVGVNAQANATDAVLQTVLPENRLCVEIEDMHDILPCFILLRFCELLNITPICTSRLTNG